jgi:hypothetical protein
MKDAIASLAPVVRRKQARVIILGQHQQAEAPLPADFLYTAVGKKTE